MKRESSKIINAIVSELNKALLVTADFIRASTGIQRGYDADGRIFVEIGFNSELDKQENRDRKAPGAKKEKGVKEG